MVPWLRMLYFRPKLTAFATRTDRSEINIDKLSPPRVSVGMPVFNTSRLMVESVDNILSQTLRDIELIICDNASTDDTYRVCQELAASDPRVRLLRNSTNLGVNPNYRRVAEESRGEYFKWAAAQDLVDRNFLERCVGILDVRPEVSLVFGQSMLFESDPAAGVPYDDHMELEDDDAVIRFRRSVEGLRLNNPINGVIRRSDLLRTFVHPDYYGADNVVLSQLALAGKLVLAPDVIFYRRMKPESATPLKTASEVLLYHYPSGGRGQLFQAWRITYGYLSAVFVSALSFGDKFRALRYVGKMACWRWPALWKDLREALQYWTGTSPLQR
jgi:glycosyltransferase involved in cell wall biosynthesis